MSETDDVKKLQARARGMLPGVAGICLFMATLVMINAFAALQGKFGTGGGKYGVLALCTFLAAGVFGLLRLRRWGWALVLAGCLTLSLGNLVVFQKTHVAPFLVQGLFALVFFLYLVRTEDWEDVGRAHGEVFGEIRPASTMLAVSALLDPRWLVEMEAEAIVGDDA